MSHSKETNDGIENVVSLVQEVYNLVSTCASISTSKRATSIIKIVKVEEKMCFCNHKRTVFKFSKKIWRRR